MLGRPRRSLWASRARRFALGIGATVLYRFLFTLCRYTHKLPVLFTLYTSVTVRTRTSIYECVSMYEPRECCTSHVSAAHDGLPFSAPYSGGGSRRSRQYSSTLGSNVLPHRAFPSKLRTPGSPVGGAHDTPTAPGCIPSQQTHVLADITAA